MGTAVNGMVAINTNKPMNRSVHCPIAAAIGSDSRGK
jgi:hypothetical protein